MTRRLPIQLAFLLVVPLLLAAAAGQAAPKKALFDNTHAETAGNADWQIDTDQPVPAPAQSTITWATSRTIWLGANSSWGVDLVKRGYQVATLTTAYGITYQNAGNPYDLSNYDVFIVNEPNTRFTAAESLAIFRYVSDGGGLVAVCDHAGSDRNSDGVDSPKAWGRLDRLHLWGAHFDSTGEANNSFSQTSGNVDTSPTNPIIHGVNGVADSLMFAAGTSMQLYPATNPNVRGDVWMNGAAHGNTQVMAAHSTYGLGRIFFLGDSSPVDDGSAAPGNSSIFDGWGDASGRDSLLIMNGTMWATRQSTGDTTPPTIAVTAPNGGETWGMGTVHAITWTASDNVAVTAVSLDYSTNNGGSWTSIATGLANSGSYNWTLPGVATTQALVRATATDAANNSANDVSGAVFTINDQTAPTATLTSPNGGEVWAMASLHNITWTATDNVGVTSVNLTWSADNGATYNTIATGLANSGSYAWTVPATATTTALVRVRAADAAGNFGLDNSNAVFTIADQTAPTVTVTSPNGGESWAMGSLHNITWSAADNVAVTAVNLTWSADGGATFQTIATGLANSGSYAWTVPATATTTGLVRARAADAGGLFGVDASDNYFTIADQGAPNATLLSPNGGENWAAGSTHALTWTATDNVGVTAVSLDYSLDNGGSWSSIAALIPNSGSLDWLVPNVTGCQARVRVTAFDAAALSGADASDATFCLVDGTAPVVGLTSPNGGETWAAGATQNVTWTATDNLAVTAVNIDYSLDGGANWTNAAVGLANSGSWGWTLPQAVSANALARVTAFDAAANSGSAVSAAVFAITDQADPTATLTAPNGGEAWTVGDPHAITWNAADNIGVTSVDLALSTDNGATWSPLAAGEANDGSFDWTVPNSATTQAMVRVTAHDAAGHTGADASDAVFTIAAQSGVSFLPATLARPMVLQNRPNPFNPTTRIGFGLPVAGHARLAIYSLEGRLVRTLADREFPSGYSELTWDGRGDDGAAQPSGVYFYRFEADGVVQTKRLVMSK